MPFKIPEDIDSLSLDELNKVLAEARAHGRELSEADDSTVEQLEEIANFIDSANEAVETKQAEAEKREAAKAKFQDPEPEPEEEPAAETEEPAEESAEEPAEEQAEEPAAEVKEPVTASAKKKGVAASLASKSTQAARPVKGTASITASADIPGIPTGGKLDDLDSVGAAMLKKMQAMPSHGRGQRSRASVANIELGRTDEFSQDNPEYRGDDMKLLHEVTRESRLSGGSLTAAGSWCAPSENMYGMCSIESTDGILDLPSINVTRGGIRFTKGPSFQDFYTHADLGWRLTDAQVQADTEKPLVDIECPDFSEKLLDAVGLGVRVPLLTQASYPELVRRWMEGVLIAHQHKVARGLYNDIQAGSAVRNVEGAVTTYDALGVLEVVAAYERQQWRMKFGETMEILAPEWFKTAVRLDLSRRNGVELHNVTDQEINAYFTSRNMRVQWLYNVGQDIINASGNISLPETATITMYPAGTWVKGQKDVISLDAVYDTESLKVNTYTGMFIEEGVFVANTCFDSVKINVPVAATGQTGAADLTEALAQSSSL